MALARCMTYGEPLIWCRTRLPANEDSSPVALAVKVLNQRPENWLDINAEAPMMSAMEVSESDKSQGY